MPIPKLRTVTYRNKWSILIILPFLVALFLLGFTVGNLLELLHLNRKDAYDLLKEILSNYISLLGIGLAIIAVLFAVIQLAYRNLNIVEIVIENTLFAPLFYFGIINILLCSLLILFNSDINSFPSDYFFIRFTIIEKYLFDLFCVFLCIVFYKTFKYVSFHDITDLYILTVKNKIDKERKRKLTDHPRDNLQIYNSELHDEILDAIDKNKSMTLTSILEVYEYALYRNPSSNFLNNYRFSFSNWLFRSFQLNKDDLSHILFESWNSQYDFLLKDPKSVSFSWISEVPLITYKNHIDVQEKKAINELIKLFVHRYKERLENIFFENASDTKVHNKNEFGNIFLVLKDLNNLSHAINSNNDIINASYILKTLGHIRENPLIYDFYIELRSKSPYVQLREDEKEALQLYEELYNYLFAIEFGNYAWLCFRLFNYDKDVHRFSTLLEIHEKYIRVDSVTIHHLFTIFHWTKKLPWDRWLWAAEERFDGEIYSLENPSTFLALGFIVRTMKAGIHKIDVTEEIYDKVDAFVFACKTTINRFRSEKRLWEDLLNLSDSTELDKKFDNLIALLDDLRIDKERLKREKLVKERLSQNKINTFKDLINKQWLQNNVIEQIFTYYNGKRVTEEPLPKIGRVNNLLHGGKVMFVDNMYEKIHNINWGFEIGDRVSQYFVQKIKQENVTIINTDSYASALEKTYQNAANVNVVFVDYQGLRHLERVLDQSGNYVRSDQFRHNYPFKFEGIYKEKILLVPLYRIKELKNTLLGVSIPDSIHLKTYNNTTNTGETLNIEVSEITDDNARKLLKQRGVSDLVKDKIEEVMSGVIIDIYQQLDFKIVDKQKIVLVNIVMTGVA